MIAFGIVDPAPTATAASCNGASALYLITSLVETRILILRTPKPMRSREQIMSTMYQLPHMWAE